MSRAAARCVNASTVRASGTLRPRTCSRTTRALRAEMPTYFAWARTVLLSGAGALAGRRDAPRGARGPAALRLAFAAAVRVVDRVHRRAAYGRTLAEPAA